MIVIEFNRTLQSVGEETLEAIDLVLRNWQGSDALPLD